ncbi:ParB/RepB/Spo0J family partition protein [Flammeovirga aprica]|uniref:ParB N-terminal domain-containing protein n=1 Tax=Flammeovirga aprica JL-4 TaxID=694437 RepID=A0A7X9XBE5_9BACT|nr:ParB/RepB/Spo0J family partition protein [Flammeovirga aprica]NME70573.1 ParB N-terminal domain-containing protein [Flammeovirga aprica JL-4]
MNKTSTSSLTYLTADNIFILEELEQYIRKQQPSELEQFRQSIQAEGIRDALILADNLPEYEGKKVLMDGHHRFKVGQELGIEEFPTIQLSFDNLEEIKIWMLKNQLGRRNTTDAERIDLAKKLTEFLAKKAKQNQASGVRLNLAKGEKAINTNDEIAKIANVSRANVTKFNKLQKERTLEEMQQVINGEKSIHKAYTELKDELHQKEIERLQKKLDKSPTPEREKKIMQLTVPYLEAVNFVLSLYIQNNINNYRIPKERAKDVNYALELLANSQLLKEPYVLDILYEYMRQLAKVIRKDNDEYNPDDYVKQFPDVDEEIFERKCEPIINKVYEMEDFKGRLKKEKLEKEASTD